MATKKQKSPLTQEQIDHAMNVVLRAGVAGQSPTPAPIPRLSRKMRAWHKQREKNQALIAESEKVSDELYEILMDFLPREYKGILGDLGLLMVAPDMVNDSTYKLFMDFIRDAKKNLKKYRALPRRSEGGKS